MGGLVPMSAMNNLKLDLYKIKYIIIIRVFQNNSFVAVVNQTML